MKSCIQCGEPTSDNYCSKCGQKQNIQRLTLSSFFSDFFSRVYGLDGAFPRTVIGLTKNPALVAQEYIKGIRGKYVGPVGYYFLIFAILLLLIEISGYEVADYFPKTEEISDSIIDETGTTKNSEAKALGRIIKSKIYSNLQYIAVLMVPFLGIWGSIWFKKSKFNVLESTVFAFFILGQAIIFNIIGFLFFALSGYKSLSIVNAVAIIYYTVCISLFYTESITFKSILKALVVYGSAFISFMIFTTAVIVLIIIFQRSFG
ncbi:MAG: DUF3667 domain-containing protein [Reichenbachiella sp.]|uniref:DUF3667 domain-containing protein n=1 Tax=Reichenbachiella sp. TaxID=2184521 RepID=UPI00326728E2